MGGEDLADQENLVPPSGHRLGNHFLRRAVPVHLRGVDEGHPQVQPGAQGRHLGRAAPGIPPIPQVP